MQTTSKMPVEQIEKLAMELRKFLLHYGMWQDVDIYYDHKRISPWDKETGEFHYNEEDYLKIEEGVEPEVYFEYVNPDHILSMSFEGPACGMIYYGTAPGIKRKFDAIFEKYGLYYEMGHHWNLSCYFIGGCA